MSLSGRLVVLCAFVWSVGFLIAFGPQMAESQEEKKEDETRAPFTVVTDGVVKKEKEHYTITFGKEHLDNAKLKKSGEKAKHDLPVKKYSFSATDKFETNGAAIAKKGKGKSGMVIEIIGIGEFQNRFPELVKANPKLATAAGFCSLFGPPYSCRKSTCTGTCTLHSIPVYCSCGN